MSIFPENVTKLLFFCTKVVDFNIWVAEFCMEIGELNKIDCGFLLA
jgi:hypothetical protein